LISSILKVVISNIVMLISNIVLGLVLPIYLTVADYGEYRLFLFYVGYIGVLHFGFIDTIYLKYGGKNKEDIDKQLLKKEHRVFWMYQLTISFVFLLVALVSYNYIMLLISLIIVPLNLGSFHKLFYQATGQFRKYSYLNILLTSLNLIFVFILLVNKIQDALSYILITVLVHIIILIILEIDFYRFSKGVGANGEVNILKYIKVGIFVLLGNIFSLLITSIGRWIVQFHFSIEEFAYYSFSIVLMNLILLIINSIGLTFYNYIAKNENRDMLILVKNILIVLGAYAGGSYFFLDLIVRLLIPKYDVALSLIAISYISFPYLMIINVILINLYKARKNEKRYFKVILIIFLLSVILNILALMIFNSMESIACATLVTIIVWYFYSIEKDFRFLRSSLNEIVFLIAHVLSFIIAVNLFSSFIGCILYFIIITFLSIAFYKAEIVIIRNRTLFQFKVNKKRRSL